MHCCETRARVLRRVRAAQQGNTANLGQRRISYIYHATLASGHGSRHGVELLQQLAVIARFIGETSSTRLDPTLLDQLTAALQATLERGTATGEWLIDAADRALCAALVSEHERQLRVTPIGSLEKAVDRAKRFATACQDKEE